MDIADQIETVPSPWLNIQISRDHGPLPVVSVACREFEASLDTHRTIVPGLWEYEFLLPLSYVSLDSKLRELIDSDQTYGRSLFALLAQNVFIEKCWSPTRKFLDDGAVLSVVGHRIV